jgi:hypothetical protein
MQKSSMCLYTWYLYASPLSPLKKDKNVGGEIWVVNIVDNYN